MARPILNAEEKMTETARFRCTISEREQIRETARKAGLSESDFLRQAALGVNIVASQSRNDPALVSALNSIGNNVNQLARATHRGSDFTRYWADVGNELRSVLKLAVQGITE